MLLFTVVPDAIRLDYFTERVATASLAVLQTDGFKNIGGMYWGRHRCLLLSHLNRTSLGVPDGIRYGPPPPLKSTKTRLACTFPGTRRSIPLSFPLLSRSTRFIWTLRAAFRLSRAARACSALGAILVFPADVILQAAGPVPRPLQVEGAGHRQEGAGRAVGRLPQGDLPRGVRRQVQRLLGPQGPAVEPRANGLLHGQSPPPFKRLKLIISRLPAAVQPGGLDAERRQVCRARCWNSITGRSPARSREGLITVTYRGTVRGRTIELVEEPPLPEGTEVEVSLSLPARQRRRPLPGRAREC